MPRCDGAKPGGFRERAVAALHKAAWTAARCRRTRNDRRCLFLVASTGLLHPELWKTFPRRYSCRFPRWSLLKLQQHCLESTKGDTLQYSRALILQTVVLKPRESRPLTSLHSQRAPSAIASVGSANRRVFHITGLLGTKDSRPYAVFFL